MDMSIVKPGTWIFRTGGKQTLCGLFVGHVVCVLPSYILPWHSFIDCILNIVAPILTCTYENVALGFFSALGLQRCHWICFVLGHLLLLGIGPILKCGLYTQLDSIGKIRFSFVIVNLKWFIYKEWGIHICLSHSALGAHLAWTCAVLVHWVASCWSSQGPLLAHCPKHQVVYRGAKVWLFGPSEMVVDILCTSLFVHVYNVPF